MRLETPPLIDSSTFSSGAKQYFVNGEVRRTSVEAFPDSGADRCYISSRLASNLGAKLVPGTERGVQLANKKSVESPGMVEVPFKFEGEQHEHTLSCWIIPNCIHDLILGRDFLGATKTLTQYARRIGNKVVSWPGKLRLTYLDGERQRLWGWFGDFFVDALPDTGSDLMLMSGQFARRIGLQVDESFENWLEVEFADGTTEWTSGVVRNVPWTVGDETIRCDFHVLEDLRVDVILSKDYLFGMNAFSEYGKFFSDTSAEVDLYKLYNAGSVGKYNGTPSIFNSEHLDELDSDAESSVVDIAPNLNGYDFYDDEILAFPKNTRHHFKQAHKRKRDETRDIFPFPQNPTPRGAQGLLG
ncbi:hypothetical protein ESCO_005787 [Escovopsis weberi]|uniref:Peptidase A2 domain-containing protein n=1 Tax=Escovopsis weberi TaxID=150374 RepID=A0A0M9VUE2_ESCWE|nr:hypothetical protein ESCO_005787 [Escovopsis weberi]